MKRELERRRFLAGLGYGTALISLPAIAGCAGPEHHLQPAKLPKQPPTAPPPAPAHTTYFDAFGVDQGVLRRVIERGLSKGASFSEVFLQHKITHWVGMEDGEVNRAYSTVDLGAGIRVIDGDATGFAFCEDLSEKALLDAAATAAAVADGPAKARPSPLAARPLVSRYTVDVPWTDVGIDQKLPLVERAEKAARTRDERIIKVTVFMSDETSHILLASSEGLLVEDEQPMAVMWVTCVGEHKGKTETGNWSVSLRDGKRFFSTARVDEVGRTAADHTVLLFDAKSPPVGEIPVVLAPGIPGILLHEAIGHGMEADFNRKGISIYADRIGKRIAPKGVTIIDSGEGRERGSLNVDDEGRESQRTVLVEDGILRTYMHDRISAKHFGVESTGSGRRESFRYPPVPRMRNTFMLPGEASPEEIVASVKDGIYAEVFTNGQVFIGAGDFTFYLKHGRRIENGKLKEVVKDANLIGSGPKVLQNVQMVGNDLVHHAGAGYCGKDGQRVPVGFGLPTLKVGAISVGGRKS